MGDNTKLGENTKDGKELNNEEVKDGLKPSYGRTVVSITIDGVTYKTKGEKMIVDGNVGTVYCKEPGIYNDVLVCTNPTEEDAKINLFRVKTVDGIQTAVEEDSQEDQQDGGESGKTPRVSKAEVKKKGTGGAKAGEETVVELALDEAPEEGVELGDLVYTEGGQTIVGSADWTQIDETTYQGDISGVVSDFPVSVTMNWTIDGEEESSDPVMMTEAEEGE